MEIWMARQRWMEENTDGDMDGNTEGNMEKMATQMEIEVKKIMMEIWMVDGREY